MFELAEVTLTTTSPGLPKLSTFRVYVGRDNIEEELPFLQCMECSRPIDEINQMFGCDYLWWRTYDKVYHTAEHWMVSKKRKNPMIENWVGAAPLSFLEGRGQVVHINYGISIYHELPCPEPGFNISRFIKWKAMSRRF